MPDIQKTAALPMPPPKMVKKNKGSKRHLVHFFILPALIFYVGFLIYPILSAFLNSFYSWNGLTRGEFAGFNNFIRLFTEKPFNDFFVGAIKHNVIYFVVTIFSKLVIAFLLAILINSKIRGKQFFKTVIFIPKLLSVIVVGYLFSLILNPTYGSLNTFLDMIGLENLARPWLGDMDLALYVVTLVGSWHGIGFAMLIFLVGLQTIPGELYEAARIDGASGIRMLFKITIPLSMPSIMIMTILTFIWSFETFDLIYAMQGSQAGPYFSTDVLVTYFYRLAFGSVEGGDSIGLGSALAVVIFMIVAVASAIQMIFFQRKQIDN
ncbi:sugar ABC transporter permease [Paenibacillus albiflavus]|uniref:Sugar ABC transporter permease n=1 Tax=Paenibacillus albiflavus TaxID=2545760 RepID=A0A4R4EGW8_9BACL|nr:sugar ABC transporter permease [Paenibacillus albiflavus]TCZ77408.1 sugar ABC transporter permease [Paenibacillus albiflavus]